MDSNQSEQSYYLSKLTSNIISPAQYPCSVIGSNKNNIHTIVPNISNSSLNINVKYQNSNDSKIAQNIAYNCYSNIANSSFNIANQNDDLKLLFSGTKPKKPHNKRIKNVSQCLNKDNDNSSDITAAPNQLTILMQEVLPAQVPDHNPLSSAHQSHISAQSLPSVISSPHNAAVLSPVAVLPSPVVDTIANVINDVLVKAMSNDPHDDVFLSVLKSRCDPLSPDNNRHIPTTFIQPHTTSPQFTTFVENNIPEESISTNKRKNACVTKSLPKRPKLSETIYSEHKPYQRCQLSAPNFRKLVHEPRISEKCVVLPPLGVAARGILCVDLGQLEDNCVKYKRTPFALARPYPRNACQDRFIVQNLNANIPAGALLASRDIPDDLDCIVAPSPNNNDLDYLSVFTSDQVSSPSINLPGPNLEMLHAPIRVQSPQLSLFHCPNKDYLTRDSSSLIRSHKCASTPTSDTSIVDSETGEMVSKTKIRNEKLLVPFTMNITDDTEARYKVISSTEETIIDKDILQSKSADYFLSLDKNELPLYSEKVYKSTSLLWVKKSREKQSLEEDDKESLADIIGESKVCTSESVTTDTTTEPGQSKDRRIFIGEIPSDTAIVVQGSVSKSKQICKRLHIVLNDKITKKKAVLKFSARQFKGTKYITHKCPQQSSTISSSFLDSSVISESQFVTMSREVGVVRRLNNVVDCRQCSVCLRDGDCEEEGTGRLLCQGLDRWIHVGCAVWYPGVYESAGGTLHGLPSECGSREQCTGCGGLGASIGCAQTQCQAKYHVECVKDQACVVIQASGNEQWSLYCGSHQVPGPPVSSVRVPRRVYVARDECNQIVAAINDDLDCRQCLRIGAILILTIGQLLPHQIHSGHYHTMNHVYPIGYRSRRMYWSTKAARGRVWYECEIVATSEDRPWFRVTEMDKDGREHARYEGDDCTGTWRQALDLIDVSRQSAGLVRLWPALMRGEDLYGLTEPWVVRAIESLPGLEAVHDYAFKYGKMELLREMPLPVCASGCVRTEVYMARCLSRHVYRSLPSYVGVSTQSGSASVTTGTITTKWQQYRRLKHDWKHNVILKRSKIQGLGLYAARDLDKGTMVIEYVGELIRNEVANKRETRYQARQQGVYMFRLDDNTVIDATRAGDMARYINHSCEPNCVTEVVTDYEGRRGVAATGGAGGGADKHIVIIANRRIEKNEELNYDYKFDLDDAGDEKIPCLCGAKNCRRWMN